MANINTFEQAKSQAEIYGMDEIHLVKGETQNPIEVAVGLIAGGIKPHKAIKTAITWCPTEGFDTFSFAAKVCTTIEKSYPDLLSALDGVGHGGIKIPALEGGAAGIVFDFLMDEKEHNKKATKWDFYVAIAELSRLRR